jgi:hypothetical protein
MELSCQFHAPSALLPGLQRYQIYFYLSVLVLVLRKLASGDKSNYKLTLRYTPNTCSLAIKPNTVRDQSRPYAFHKVLI